MSLEKIVDIDYVVSRLKKLLKKKYVLRSLLEDPEYRKKLYFVSSIIGLDLFEEASLSVQGFQERV